MEKKQAELELISPKKGVVKVAGVKPWLVAVDENVKKSLYQLQKGELVEYEAEGTKLFSIKSYPAEGQTTMKPEAKPHEPQQTARRAYQPTGTEPMNFTEIMRNTIAEVDDMMALVSDPDIRKTMNWAAVCNTLFLGKTNSNGKRY